MAAKLSERQKKNIVAAYAAGGVSYVELAKKYDVSKETVRRIIKKDSDFVKKCDTIKNEAEEEAGKDLADAVYDRQTMAQELLDDILRSDNNKRRPWGRLLLLVNYFAASGFFATISTPL